MKEIKLVGNICIHEDGFKDEDWTNTKEGVVIIGSGGSENNLGELIDSLNKVSKMCNLSENEIDGLEFMAKQLSKEMEDTIRVIDIESGDNLDYKIEDKTLIILDDNYKGEFMVTYEVEPPKPLTRKQIKKLIKAAERSGNYMEIQRLRNL